MVAMFKNWEMYQGKTREGRVDGTLRLVKVIVGVNNQEGILLHLVAFALQRSERETGNYRTELGPAIKTL